MTANDANGYVPLGLINSEYDYETWVQTLALYDGGAEVLTIQSTSSGATRGAGIAFDAANFLAGDYRITFDISSRTTSAALGFGVQGMNLGGTHAYNIDTVEAAGIYMLARTGATNNFRSTIVADHQLTAVGSYSYDITMNGNDDLVLLFSGMTAAGSLQSSSIDNLVIEAIPEPTTLSLVTLLGASMFFMRRKF